MINPAPEIRKKLFALLDGNISYDGGVIPVYEGEDTPILPYKIILGDYSDSGKPNKHGFQSEASQVIEIISEQATGMKKHVDAIGQLVCNLIHPSPRSTQWSTTDLTIVMQGKPGLRHLIEDSGDNKRIVRLIMRYNIIIIE